MDYSDSIESSTYSGSGSLDWLPNSRPCLSEEDFHVPPFFFQPYPGVSFQLHHYSYSPIWLDWWSRLMQSDQRRSIWDQMPSPSPFHLGRDDKTVYMRPTTGNDIATCRPGLYGQPGRRPSYTSTFNLNIPMDHQMMERFRSELADHLERHSQVTYTQCHCAVDGEALESVMERTRRKMDSQLTWRMEACLFRSSGCYPVDCLTLCACSGEELDIIGPKIIWLRQAYPGRYVARDYLYLDTMIHDKTGPITLCAPVVFLSSLTTELTVECDHLVLDSELVDHILGENLDADQTYDRLESIMARDDWPVLKKKTTLITLQCYHSDLQLLWKNGTVKRKSGRRSLPPLEGIYYSVEEGDDSNYLPSPAQLEAIMPRVVITGQDSSLRWAGYEPTISLEGEAIYRQVWSRPTRAKSARK